MNKLQKIIAWLLIPKGFYCEGCPFWFIDKTEPEQMNGYYSYLSKGDWNFYKEMPKKIVIEKRQSDGTYKKEFTPKDPMFGTLLWDGVKECGRKSNH